jgi:hypothetical protein
MQSTRKAVPNGFVFHFLDTATTLERSLTVPFGGERNQLHENNKPDQIAKKTQKKKKQEINASQRENAL